MPDQELQDLNAELARVKATIASVQEGGVTSIGGLDRNASLISLGSLRAERYRILREIRNRRRKLAGVDPWGGVVQFGG